MSGTWNEIWQQVRETFVSYAPNILGALAILIVGWIAALLISKVVESGLRRLGVGGALADQKEKQTPVPKLAGRVTFYTLMLLVLVAFFQALRLTLITAPLNELLTGVLTYAPQVLGALVLVFLAWITARLVRFVVTKGSRALKIEDRLGDGFPQGAQTEGLPQSMGNVAYWLVFLLFLPGILGALELNGLLAPVQELTTKLFVFLPNLLAAAVILLLGWVVAKVVQRIVSGLLASAGADSLMETLNLQTVFGKRGISGIVGYILYFLILIPVLISALAALQLEAITRPANQMLEMTLSALPMVFAAVVLLGVSYLVGKFLSGIVVNVVERIGINNMFGKLGFPHQSPETGRVISQAIGTLVFAGVMLFAAIEAFGLLQFDNLALLLTEFMTFLSQVALGFFVLAVGLIFANLAHRLVMESGAQYASILAPVAKVAVIVLAVGMALRQMGLADEIVTVAFTFVMGAVAVAAAIAFGLGGREAAAQQITEWRNTLQNGKSR